MKPDLGFFLKSQFLKISSVIINMISKIELDKSIVSMSRFLILINFYRYKKRKFFFSVNRHWNIYENE